MSKRYIKNLDTPLGFGKHADLSINEINDEDPTYLAWLLDENVIELEDEDDQAEFESMAAEAG